VWQACHIVWKSSSWFTVPWRNMTTPKKLLFQSYLRALDFFLFRNNCLHGLHCVCRWLIWNCFSHIQIKQPAFLKKMQSLTFNVFLSSHTSFPLKGVVGAKLFTDFRRFLRIALPRPYCLQWMIGENIFSGGNWLEQFFFGARGYRRTRRRYSALKKPLPEKEKEMEMDLQIGMKEELPEDDENVLNITGNIHVDSPMEKKLALNCDGFSGIKSGLAVETSCFCSSSKGK